MTTPREQARWENGVKQRSTLGLIESPGNRGQVFCMTPEGYEAADVRRRRNRAER